VESIETGGGKRGRTTLQKALMAPTSCRCHQRTVTMILHFHVDRKTAKGK
jgi:hypothetical protein